MAKLIGRFYFKKTDSGNLIGEFSNQTSFNNSTESADLISSSTSFEGEYNSTWQEDGKPCFAKLFIRPKSKKHKNIFSLEWHDHEKTIYWGEALVSDGILIGDYRNFENV